MIGGQMLDEDERHARVGGEVLQKLGERLQAAGGSTCGNDRKPLNRFVTLAGLVDNLRVHKRPDKLFVWDHRVPRPTHYRLSGILMQFANTPKHRRAAPLVMW
jgi:hypothetical protein